jgi:hypothetical protein
MENELNETGTSTAPIKAVEEDQTRQKRAFRKSRTIFIP